MTDLETLKRRQREADADLAAATEAQSILANLQAQVAEANKELGELQAQAERMEGAKAQLEREIRRLEGRRQALDAEQLTEEHRTLRDVATLGLILAADDIGTAIRALERRGWVGDLYGVWKRRAGDLAGGTIWHALRSELLTAATQVGRDLTEHEKTAGAVAGALK